MRARVGAVFSTVGLVASALGACGGDDGRGDAAPDEPISVVISDDTPSIVKVSDVRCALDPDNDTHLLVSGVVSSSGDDTHYVSLQIRFVDGDGVRVELATDTITDLQVGERARWDAESYSDGAGEVTRCEVTATVS